MVGGERVTDGASFEEIQDSLRSEWCKARAHARRPREELRLVEEEMHRSIEYCYYVASWWERQIGRRDVSPFLQEGLTAYAKEHAHVERNRGRHWAQLWHPIRERAKVILSHLLDPPHNATLPSMSPLEVEVEMDEDKGREESDDDGN
ncbi:hypothetical protein E1B28_013362 [Marasmius oreades]|uniref:Uncharacterized protein n=1 Tax=Marasmius oreades TaxID=181124 RepID=A0A9P7UNY1_9AGAR|nr:uncharacterized protein E1B28_013362 [Marasmius oreades]KAG7087391.1 hypothetical protein E1B28_013362 [Marasmius oreades]